MAEGQVVDVIKLFKDAALEVSNRKLDQLDRSTVISQLGMDSVAVMELVSYFEEKLNVRMPDEDLARINTIGDLSTLIQRLLPNAKVQA
ncbi:MAG TPA: acyl carrier protein [Myxococcaceae bacterium]|jgi:acyl carrier protein|nr:acyl carrier protein [Myxococcaceae bacterium]